MKLFSGERRLVITGLTGFALAAGIAVYILMHGAVVLPEGRVDRAFSFDAAIGMFILSVAAFLPLAGLSDRKRTVLRRIFIYSTLYSYAVETIQQFRGINPRFSQVGSVADTIAGSLFGLVSLLIIIVTVLVGVSFFRKRSPDDRTLLTLGIRYAFLSIMAAFAAGIWMIALQGSYTGEAGNIIVLHGLGFHALQTLPLLGWLLDRARADHKHARMLIHAGSIAWTVSIALVGWQTALGRTVFELTALPLLAGLCLLVWLAATAMAASEAIRQAISTHAFA